MLSRLFPKAFDNAYRGHWLATKPIRANKTTLARLVGRR